MFSIIRFLFRWLLTLIFLFIIGFAGIVAYDFWQFSKKDFTIPRTTITINRGDDLKKVIDTLLANGLDGRSWQWILLAKIKKAEHNIKAGEYLIEGKTNAVELLDKLVKGDFLLLSVRIPEGKTFAEIRKIFAKNSSLIQDIPNLSDEELIIKNGIKAPKIEGMLFPDTYRVLSNSSDTEIIKLSAQKMQKLLDELWLIRAENLPFSDPYQALILASIVEKESGHSDDTPLVASVYINRLRINMPLQADPTVIYGMGENFKGNIRKVDLETYTPYNTYKINGLPPTPISTVSKASLQAVLNPPTTRYLYFVSKGNGRSYFSETLAEHNQAVNTYILKR